MQYLKYFIIAFVAFVALGFLIITYLKKTYESKPSSVKLAELDEKFMNDSSLSEACVYIKDLKNDKEHKIVKGDFTNKKFYLASVSKLFTHALIFQLIDEGILDYNGTISSYLNEREWAGIAKSRDEDFSGRITIKNLIDQTSGLADYETDFRIEGKQILVNLLEKDFSFSFQSAVDATRTLMPVSEPGKFGKAYYSNLNSLLLGRIAEVASKKSLYLLFKERIFDKLGLNCTRLVHNQVDIIPVRFGTKKHNPIKYISSAPAAGGIASTLEDTMTFIQAFFKGDLFDIKHIENVSFMPIQFYPIKYGAGMMEVEMNSLMSPIVPAPKIVGHSGSTGSFAFFDKASKIFIVGTSNQAKTNPFKYIYSYLDAL